VNATWLREFQVSHRDWEGRRLDVDGVRGPRTQWALSVARLEPWRQAIIERACSVVGATESDGTNRSVLIDSWNRRCGVALGSPYCASFVSWCISVEGLPEVRNASAQGLGRQLRAVDLILPADVMWFPTGEHTGHCGVVIGLGPGEVACVEGNQDNAVRVVRRETAKVRFATPLPVQSYPGIPPGLTLVPVQFVGTR
jgi:hypothetical protein